MDPPSAELVRILTELGLATARDLHRCRSSVRKLGRGLPVYDSLWIDALVRRRTINPFQARKLENHTSDELRVGSRLVLESCQHSDHELRLFTARDPKTREQFFVSQVDVPSHRVKECTTAFESLIRELSSQRDRLPFSPVGFATEGNRFSIISPFANGQTLGRLLVRRGRFPEVVVRAIAIELARELAAVESTISHGDLRPANVLLTDTGHVCLLNWGVINTVSPRITIHSVLPWDAYDVLAPERIDQDVACSPRTDMYSLGCLLWQLLAGRPPYVMADVLGKLNSHRQRQIPDVRTIAPETSPELAQLLRLMTFREPHRRPQGFSEVLANLNSGAAGGRRRLKQFFRDFESAAPRRPANVRTRGRNSILTASLATAATAVLVLVAWNRSNMGLPELTSAEAATEMRTAHVPTGEDEAPPNDHNKRPGAAKGLTPLPQPDVNGHIQLTGGVHYSSGELKFDGPLVVNADSKTLPTIIVDEKPLSFDSETLLLENVRIVSKAATSGAHLMQVNSQELSIRHCSFVADGNESDVDLIEWKLRDSADPHAGRLLVTDTIFDAPGTVLVVDSPLTTGLFENVFRRGRGALVNLRRGVRSGLKVPLVVNRCTFQESGPLVLIPEVQLLSQSGRLSIQGEDSLLDLTEDSGLIELIGPEVPQWEFHLEVSAQGLITRPGLQVFARRNSQSAPAVELSSPRALIDGLLTGDFHFSSETASGTPGGRVVIDSLPIHLSPQPPGVDPKRLPDFTNPL